MEVLVILIVLAFALVFAYFTQKWSMELAKSTSKTIIKYDPTYTKMPAGSELADVVHRNDSDLAKLEEDE